MGLDVGNRVLRKGWERYSDFQYLARLGRVVRVVSPNLLEVRWDSSAESRPPFKDVCPGAPARVKLHRADELMWLWWRST